MADHDGRYKRFFSHPRMVRDLLRGFLREEWVSWADLGTLQRVSSSFTHGDLRQKHGDMLWRFNARPGKDWIDFYLLLEFQSTPDRFLSVRLMSYVSGLLEDLLKRRELAPGRSLPLVLPVVLYRGRPPWKAPLDLRGLFAAAPESFVGSLPCLPYRLIDLERLLPDDLDQTANLAAAFFRIETWREPADLEAVAGILQQQLATEKGSWLRRCFFDLLTKEYQEAFPGATISDVNDLEDVIMFAENLKRWKRDTIREAKREATIEGMQSLLLGLIEDRFGAVPAELRRKVRSVTSQAELQKLTLQAAKAADLDQLAVS